MDAVKWSANGYRLPTEAEWEFAARGGNSTHAYTYSGSNTVGDVAWYSGNSGITTHTVGQKAANKLGIYDMSGNVWEWCWDWYGSAYPSGGTIDPKGPSATQTYRLLRGGSFVILEDLCRVVFRNGAAPSTLGSGDLGFRCVQEIGTNGIGNIRPETPSSFSLNQNYPNPFNPSTTIRYALPNRSSVKIVVTNTLGQQVAVLENGDREAGYNEVQWNAKVASGIYFYRIDAVSISDPNNRFVQVKKMLLLK